MKTVNKLLEEAAEGLSRKNIPEPQVNAQILLSDVLKCKRLDLFLKSNDIVDDKLEGMYNSKLQQRCKHVPLSYITGCKEFMGLDFKVSEEVLIPRDETEILVEETVKLVYREGITQPFIFDIGTGCGNISISLATLLPDSNIFGIDISETSIRLAQENARLNNVEKRTNFVCEDLFGLSSNCSPLFPVPCIFPFDLIVSNPPYIPAAEIDMLQEEIRHEPRESLDGGADGLKFYMFMAKSLKKCLKDRGYIILETGHNQAEKVREIFENSGYKFARIAKDYMGYDRVVIFKN